jgi:hypothetical protein
LRAKLGSEGGDTQLFEAEEQTPRRPPIGDLRLPGRESA